MHFFLLTYNGSQAGDSAENAAGAYDITNACPGCGTGAEVFQPIPIKNFKTKRNFLKTFTGDYLISKKLYEKLKSKKVNLSFIQQVVNYKLKTKLDYFYLLPVSEFPKMDLSLSSGIGSKELQCTLCKKNGFGDELIKTGTISNIISPRKYVYPHIESDQLMAHDFFNTWEHFGPSRLKAEGIFQIGFARPRIIVSEKVKEVFEMEKIKNAVFEEVSIINILLGND